VDNILGGYPPKPRSIAETGLASSFLIDLALKTVYVHGLTLGVELVDAMKLPFDNIAEKLLEYLVSDGYVEVVGSAGTDASGYKYVISNAGRLRARELMDQCQYTGPAPVSLAAYSDRVIAQSLAGQTISHDEFERALDHLVLPEDLLNQLGPAINAGKAIFIYGNTGNGKTSIGLAAGEMFTTPIWIPYSILVDGVLIKVFDSTIHRPLQENSDSGSPLPSRKGLLGRLVAENLDADYWIRNRELLDDRWVLVRRPLVVGGGELTLKNLDLVFDPTLKYYEAPHQMKANGGVFLVDDLGRQKASAREILNRWILPLEKRMDHLTPLMGNRIEVPFDPLLIFATNLDPTEVADEVFLRRLRYKIQVADPTWEAYAEIFRREAAKRNMAYSEEGAHSIVQTYYLKPKRAPRGVHPRDILDELVDIARYRGVPPTMSKELLDLACQAYFLKENALGAVN